MTVLEGQGNELGRMHVVEVAAQTVGVIHSSPLRSPGEPLFKTSPISTQARARGVAADQSSILNFACRTPKTLSQIMT